MIGERCGVMVGLLAGIGVEGHPGGNDGFVGLGLLLEEGVFSSFHV
jgi:hypothetical protein